MTQVNIIQDLSLLTHIPNKAISELISKEMLCIGSAIHDAKATDTDILVLNIGLGTLSIELSSMQCKFVPNKDLKKIITQSLTSTTNPLEYELEQAIIEKLSAICEDVV